MDRIRSDPGIHLQALIDQAGVGNGAVRHHIRVLVDAGLVERDRTEGFHRFFPKGYPGEERTRASVLRAGCNREVYEAYLEQPDRSIRDIAGEVDRSASTVHRAIRMLRDAGLLPAAGEDGGENRKG